MDLKTIAEWEKVFDTFVMDADGFPIGTHKYETLFTEKDFLENCKVSTIRFSEKILKAMNNSK